MIKFFSITGFLTIVCFFISCVPTDSGIRDRTNYFYINNSDYLVTISVLSPKPFDFTILDSVIPIGDTIRFNNREPEGLSYPFGYDSLNLMVKLTISSIPITCLDFNGKIMDDSISNDIRSSSSYLPHYEGDGLAKLYYTITNNHVAKSVPCN